MSEESRHDLSEAAWVLLEPQLPDRRPQRGGRWADHRRIIDGIRWRTRTGSPWRDVPARYGHWRTVYGRHRRWCGDGTWTKVADALRTEADKDPAALDGEGAWKVAVDSTVARASAEAAGARHQPPLDVPEQLLQDLAAAVPAGARTTGSSGSPPTAASSTTASPATSDSSPAARAEDQGATPEDAASSTEQGADGEATGHGDAGDGGAGGERRAGVRAGAAC